jgi:hypothetical protein
LGIRGDTAQIASVLLDDPSLTEQSTLPKDLTTWKNTILLVDAAKQDIQAHTLDYHTLGISEDEFETLSNSLSSLISKGSSFSWMFRTSGKDEGATPNPEEPTGESK